MAYGWHLFQSIEYGNILSKNTDKTRQVIAKRPQVPARTVELFSGCQFFNPDPLRHHSRTR